MRQLGTIAFALFALGWAIPSGTFAKTVTCQDGTTSRAGKGACSHHGGVAAPAPQAAEEPVGGASVNCKDGTTSKPGRGACSHHGGIASATSAPAAKLPESPHATVPTSAGAPKNPDEMQAAASPAGATARCKDGTYSHAAQHSGACSHHGGVAEWMK